ncbi:MAG TPA: NAD(P)-dependent oxidoreductase [Edaphobacter sp.]|nr:NAD(P)-dependent oxidoreductase [Edaphobacter sp.]
MSRFKLFFTGDYLGSDGKVKVGDIGLDTLAATGYIETSFLRDQQPAHGDDTYWDKLYSLEITPRHVAEANGIVIFRPWVKSSAFINGAENLLVLARAGAGYDKIDISACTANDVVVFNAPDTLTHSTASAALTLLLALAKKLPQQQELVHAGRWDRQPEFMGDDLIGKTLGIIGLGKTGAELARLLAPFHMKIVSYSPSADPLQAEALGVQLVDLDTLLSISDFVSLHCRLEERTRGMLGERELSLLKPTAYLINVGRGELIHEQSLVQLLREEKIAGAGLDVFEAEPLPVDHPLLALKNVILTPHWLPSTHRAAHATRDVITRNVIRVAQGLIPQNVVNPEVLQRPGFRTKLAQFEVNRP